MPRTLAPVGLVLALLLPRAASGQAIALQEGDLVFQTSRSAQSRLIRLVTDSPRTHVGVVLRDRDRWVVLEASRVVRMTPYAAFVAHGEGGVVAVRRLARATSVLSPAALERVHAQARAWLGRSYDTRFAWDDERLYCSELVYKLFERAADVRIGVMERVGDLRLHDTAVQREIRRRFGSSFSEDTRVVTPESLFRDPQLVDAR